MEALSDLSTILSDLTGEFKMNESDDERKGKVRGERKGVKGVEGGVAPALLPPLTVSHLQEFLSTALHYYIISVIILIIYFQYTRQAQG